MTNRSPRLLLIVAVWIAVISLLCGFAWILMQSMKPTEATFLAHQMEVDISTLKAGEVLKVDWEGTDIFVLRRTAAQIEWLKNHAPPILNDYYIEDISPSSPLANRFRSLFPEYFVFRVQKDGRQWILYESRYWGHGCDDFRYSPEPLRVSEHTTFPGGFFCAFMYGQAVSDVRSSPFVYDPAGRTQSVYYQPLNVPPYFFKGKTLVIGPQG